MSDANRLQIAYVKESTYGVHPGGAMQIARITSEGLKPDTGYIFSNELRSDRQRADLIRNDIGASGPLNFELSYLTFHDWMEAVLQSTWVSSASIDAADTGIAAVASGNKFTHATAWANTPTAAGLWIRVTGFATAANNGYFKIVSRTSTEIVVSGGTLVNESAGPAVTILQGGVLTNGTTQSSYSIERTYADLSSELVNYPGCVFDSMSLTVNTDGILVGSFGIIGAREVSATASSGSSYGAATTTPVMNSIDDVVAIQEGLATLGVTGFTINVANNLRKRKEVANLGAVSIGAGTIDVTGSLTAYYTSKTIVDKLLNDTATSLQLIAEDSAGNGYVFDFSQVKYSEGRRVGGGINTDVTMEMQWSAYRDPTELTTIRIYRFTA